VKCHCSAYQTSTHVCSLNMLPTLEICLPQQRSPEELRGFYAIALEAKDDSLEAFLNKSKYLDRSNGDQLQNRFLHDLEFLNDGRTQSSSSASLFSQRTQPASPATSISDINSEFTEPTAKLPTPVFNRSKTNCSLPSRYLPTRRYFEIDTR
jgi:hypothetical protein